MPGRQRDVQCRFSHLFLQSIAVQCLVRYMQYIGSVQLGWWWGWRGSRGRGAGALSRPGELDDCESANWKCTALEREGEGGEGGERKRRYWLQKKTFNQEQRSFWGWETFYDICIETEFEFTIFWHCNPAVFFVRNVQSWWKVQISMVECRPDWVPYWLWALYVCTLCSLQLWMLECERSLLWTICDM